MPTIYEKVLDSVPVSGDRMCILDTREALVYPFPYDDWNVLTMSFVVSITTAESDNGYTYWGHNGGYTRGGSNPTNRIFFGLKGDSENFPGVEQEVFIGALTSSGDAFVRSVYNAFAGPSMALENYQNNLIDFGVVHSNGRMQVKPHNDYFMTPNPDAQMSSGIGTFSNNYSYGAFHTMRFTVNDKGKANQSISVEYYTNMAHNGSDPEGYGPLKDSDMHEMMETRSYSTIGTFPWNNAGGPYDIPNAIFMYLPFTEVRLRVHRLGVIKKR